MEMKPTHWIIATAVAAVSMISYVHAYIYPRTEGQTLQKRMDDLGPVIRDIDKRLSRIEGALGVKK